MKNKNNNNSNSCNNITIGAEDYRKLCALYNFFNLDNCLINELTENEIKKLLN